jgi:hypothetical protein
MPRRAADRDAAVHQALAAFVDVFHGIRQVSEIPAAAVFLRVPVERQLDLRAFITGSCQENQREPPLWNFFPAQFHQAQLVAVKVQ